jgi:DNA helicase-2/ATP-dependent DNA helicase PcrA
MLSTELTKQQIKAVNYIDGPLLIVAGPGTGKTGVLTEKIIYLVENGFDPNRILVCTFTVKAAEELKERIRLSLKDRVESMHISTIHSFCRDMLDTFPEYHNLGNVFKIIDDLEQFIYVNRNYWNLGLRDFAKDIDAEELINFYNKCTESDVSPDELVKYYNQNSVSEQEKAIAKSYKLYINSLLDPNDTKLDFALLQREFYHLLMNSPEILNAVRNMFDYILIDEYQDTNPIQDAIIKLISEPKFKIAVVGDEDQSIYGFRGSSIKNFMTFMDRYPNAKRMELEENFRSSKEIVDTFDEFMLSHRKFDKRIFTHNSGFSEPILIEGSSPIEEGKNVAKLIRQLVGNHNVKFGDIAILFKSVKYHSPKITKVLTEEKVPFIIIGDGALISRDEIKNFIVIMFYANFEVLDDFIKKWLLTNGSEVFRSEILNLESKTIEKLSPVMDPVNLLSSIDLSKLRSFNILPKDAETLMNLKNLEMQQKKNTLVS